MTYMEMSDQLILKFKYVVEKDIGHQITWEEAERGTKNLILLAELVLGFRI